jgi:glycosyltransferase involved in cell wall biosynthesis
MALGCPVIASNAAAVPEVCGPAALYFHPDDAAGLAAQIQRLLFTPGERERLRCLGRAQLDKYSWDACARSFLRALAGLQARKLGHLPELSSAAPHGGLQRGSS